MIEIIRKNAQTIVLTDKEETINAIRETLLKINNKATAVHPHEEGFKITMSGYVNYEKRLAFCTKIKKNYNLYAIDKIQNAGSPRKSPKIKKHEKPMTKINSREYPKTITGIRTEIPDFDIITGFRPHKRELILSDFFI